MLEQSAQPIGGGASPALPLQIRREDVWVELCDSRWANEICEKHHYLHRKRYGRLVAYSVSWLGDCEGVLLFARAPVCHAMFGFKPTEIVELARVWFKSNPANLGSCAIRFACKKLSRDWPGVKAIVSWCDTSRFDGALYKATGFKFMGMSRVRSIEPSAKKFGGGRPGRKVQTDRLNPKQRWILVL